MRRGWLSARRHVGPVIPSQELPCHGHGAQSPITSGTCLVHRIVAPSASSRSSSNEPSKSHEAGISQLTPGDLDVEFKAYRAVGSNRIHGLHSVRAVLAALDQHSAPSPLSVRFGRGDVVEVVVDGVTLALDTADSSVSEPMIRNREYEPEVTRVLREFI